jgi:hypothetical protein
MLPAWHRDVFYSSLLMGLTHEARSDLLLSIDIPALAAWLTRLDPMAQAQLLESAPTALYTAIRAASIPSKPAQRAALERVARIALSRGFHAQLARNNADVEGLIIPRERGAA